MYLPPPVVARRVSRSPSTALQTVALIGTGGFAGAALRYLVATVAPGLGGTLVANAFGSLALGFVVYETVYAGAVTERTRLVVAVGFLSSFTTYSTFALQSLLASPPLLAANVGASYAFGFVGVLIGRGLARRARGWS